MKIKNLLLLTLYFFFLYCELYQEDPNSCLSLNVVQDTSAPFYQTQEPPKQFKSIQLGKNLFVKVFHLNDSTDTPYLVFQFVDGDGNWIYNKIVKQSSSSYRSKGVAITKTNLYGEIFFSYLVSQDQFRVFYGYINQKSVSRNCFFEKLVYNNIDIWGRVSLSTGENIIYFVVVYSNYILVNIVDLSFYNQCKFKEQKFIFNGLNIGQFNSKIISMLAFQDQTGILFALDSSNQYRIQYYFDQNGRLLGNQVFNEGFLVDTQNVNIDYVFLKMEQKSDIYTILVGNQNTTVAQDKYFYIYTYGYNGTLICSQKFESFDNIRFNFIMFGYVTENLIWVKAEDQQNYSLFFYMNPRSCSYFIKSGESDVSVISASGNINTVNAKFYSLVNKEGKFSIAALGNTFITTPQNQYSDFICQKAQRNHIVNFTNYKTQFYNFLFTVCLNECQSCTTISGCDTCIASDPIRETNQCYCPENYYNIKGYGQCCPQICVYCQKYYSCDTCSQSKIQKEDYNYLKHCSCPLNYFGCLEQNSQDLSICNKYENKVALLDICISQIGFFAGTIYNV